MSLPKYQVFVSSTYRDLEEERAAILNAILRLNQFPAGMELFPATDDTAWTHIKKVIAESDYYVLVIAGRYGSVDESGISYTEKEYDFAVSQNIPVLAFVRSDPDNIPLGKSEVDEQTRDKLLSFKEKVGKKHHLNYWTSADDLKAEVLSSLSMAFVMNPQKGWERSSGIGKTELLEQFADLQRRYDTLSAENSRLMNETLAFTREALSQGNDQIEFAFSLLGFEASVVLTYDEIFFSIGEKLFAPTEFQDVKNCLSKIVFEKFETTGQYSFFIDEKKPDSNRFGQMYETKIREAVLTELEIQFQALDLISVSGYAKQYMSKDIGDLLAGHNQGSVKTKIARTWTFTEAGRKYFLSQRASRRAQPIVESPSVTTDEIINL